MGMTASLAAVDQATLSRLKSDPGAVEDYIYPNDGDDEPPNSIDVDKAWHGIHFLLTGQAEGGQEPLALALLGGEELGDDVGYGPARFLTPQQVNAVATALVGLDEEAFRDRFDPAAMTDAQIYPDVIWLRDGKDALDYLVENYHSMVSFYREAASRGDGALLWLC